jgi:hypothetical protein
MLKDVFDQIVEGYDLTLHNTLQRLTATSASTPTVMERPEGFHNIQYVKYDKKLTAGGDQNFQDVDYVTPYEFTTRTSTRPLSDASYDQLRGNDST